MDGTMKLIHFKLDNKLKPFKDGLTWWQCANIIEQSIIGPYRIKFAINQLYFMSPVSSKSVHESQIVPVALKLYDNSHELVRYPFFMTWFSTNAA